MGIRERIDIERTLDAVFDAERDRRQASRTLLRAPHDAVLKQVRRAREQAEGKKREERALRLVCLTHVLRSMPGAGAIDGIIDVLGSECEEGGHEAAVALEDLAWERLPDVCKGIERAVARLPAGSLALCELPFVILKLGDVDVLSMLRPFVFHVDPDAVAAAIEACVEYSDPVSIPWLEELYDDPRAVQYGDESTDGPEQMTVGDAAARGVYKLREVESMLAGEGEA